MKSSPRLFCEISKKFKPKYVYHANREWEVRGKKMRFPRAYIPKEVKEILKTSPENMFESERYEEEIKQNTTIDYNEFLNWKKPDLKSQLIDIDPLKSIKNPDSFIFNQYNVFEYGIHQALLLTKTKIMETKFPLSNAINLPPYCRQIIERFIYKSNYWITNEDKLPRRYSPSKAIYRHKSEFGIAIKDNIRFLLKELFEFSEFILESKTKKRMFNKDHFLETFYYWNGHRIQFRENRDFVISSTEALLPFDETTAVEWDPAPHLSVISPINPCIDFQITNHYPLVSCDGWKSSNVSHKYPHLITVNLDRPNIHTDFLEPEARQITQQQKIAIGIMNCFAQSLATARRLFGDEIVDKGDLPHPICLHAICFDSVQFDFISYQLNSTNFSDSKLANLAWVDEENKFFDKHIAHRGMLRNNRFENLNLEVFSKFLQYFQYGCK